MRGTGGGAANGVGKISGNAERRSRGSKHEDWRKIGGGSVLIGEY